MPLYEFECENCYVCAEVVRKIGDNRPPERDELTDNAVMCTMDDSATHSWRRVMSVTHVDRGPNWNYRKPT